MNPENIKIDAFDYPLPADRIAEKPLEQRDSSKLLIYRNGEIRHSKYSELAHELPSNSALFFNNTRVIPARLHFQKKSGGHIEVFLLEPESGNYETLYQKTAVSWKCMVGGVKKWKNQESLSLSLSCGEILLTLTAKLVSKSPQFCTIQFSWDGEIPFLDVIHVAGQIPLPPYIKRAANENDRLRYQTIYADYNGSVAAPTAGLHFNNDLMAALRGAGFDTSFLTLHVGAGTFRPVAASTIAEHEMHEEHFEVDREALEALVNGSKKIIPVGTTSMRTLESLYWIGVKLFKLGRLPENGLCLLKQWEDIILAKTNPASKEIVFNWLISQMRETGIQKLRGKTGICIIPGYQFRVCNGLITNFHQPKSTLLLLVAAIAGDNWKYIYETALAADYRFLSFGDGSLILMPD